MTEAILALFLLACLTVFFSISLCNILKVQKSKGETKFFAEVERPGGFIMGLSAFGTVVYFIEAFLYLLLVFTDMLSLTEAFHVLSFSFGIYVKIIGLVLTSIGTFLFVWSVIARDRYAVLWEMPENQRLVTWGPYRYVRHPSYLGYSFMFFGLFFLWSGLPTFFPLLAIPGYYYLTFAEERLLVSRFGDEYLEYQNKTGRFIPKLS